MPAPRLFVSAVEPSGDRLAADAVRELRRDRPDLEATGCAGPRLRAEGVSPVVMMEDVAVMGISAVLTRLPTVLEARARLQTALRAQPSVALFVDGPSMHLPLAQEARARGTTTIGLVCPQVWAWKPERTGTIARAYDHLLCLFDFEPPLLAAAAAVHGCAVTHVGHPVLDRLPSATARTPCPTPLFGLAPGSRQQELAHHLDAFLETARRVRQDVPGARFLLAGRAPQGAPSWLEATDSIADLQACHAVLTKSGTVTLELAWMGVPQVVAHQVSAATLLAGRLLVRHVDHIALPNVLNRRAVVPEHLGRPDPARLARALLDQRGAPPVPLPSVGQPGATARIAACLASALGHRGSRTGPSPRGRLPGAP